MEINVYLDNIAIYGLAYRLDIKTGQKSSMVMDKPEEADDVFANNDDVLHVKKTGDTVELDALAPGTSKLWITKGQTIVRELLVNIVDEIQRPATALGVTLGDAEPK